MNATTGWSWEQHLLDVDTLLAYLMDYFQIKTLTQLKFVLLENNSDYNSDLKNHTRTILQTNNIASLAQFYDYIIWRYSNQSDVEETFRSFQYVITALTVIVMLTNCFAIYALKKTKTSWKPPDLQFASLYPTSMVLSIVKLAEASVWAETMIGSNLQSNDDGRPHLTVYIITEITGYIEISFAFQIVAISLMRFLAITYPIYMHQQQERLRRITIRFLIAAWLLPLCSLKPPLSIVKWYYWSDKTLFKNIQLAWRGIFLTIIGILLVLYSSIAVMLRRRTGQANVRTIVFCMGISIMFAISYLPRCVHYLMRDPSKQRTVEDDYVDFFIEFVLTYLCLFTDAVLFLVRTHYKNKRRREPIRVRNIFVAISTKKDETPESSSAAFIDTNDATNDTIDANDENLGQDNNRQNVDDAKGGPSSLWGITLMQDKMSASQPVRIIVEEKEGFGVATEPTDAKEGATNSKEGSSSTTEQIST